MTSNQKLTTVIINNKEYVVLIIKDNDGDLSNYFIPTDLPRINELIQHNDEFLDSDNGFPDELIDYLLNIEEQQDVIRAKTLKFYNI